MSTKFEVVDAPPEPAKRRLELVVAALKVPAHLVAGLKQHRHWQDDTEVSDSDVTAAVAEVLSITLG
jgi:hypothetical protein